MLVVFVDDGCEIVLIYCLCCLFESLGLWVWFSEVLLLWCVSVCSSGLW